MNHRNILNCLIIIGSIATLGSNAAAFTKCVSVDQKVNAAIEPDQNESDMYEITISSNNSNRPAESKFPASKVEAQKQINYHLVRSEFVLLSINSEDGSGKLANGQFFGPNPYIDVKCE